MTDVAYEYPWIVSADDHICEPPSLWWDRLSARDREDGPRVIQDTCQTIMHPGGRTEYVKGGDGPLTDFWTYDGWAKPMGRVSACAGLPWTMHTPEPINYADMRPGYYDPAARVADMDINHMERSLCFPNFIRFCGQIFHEAKDKTLAMKGVKAYNDWMIEEWCGSSGGRLIPLCLVPFWDPQASAAEIRRNAGRGSRAITFPEMPHYLGLPSIYDPDGFWEPVWDACNETGTVVCMHIGSGSKLVESSPGAPMAVILTMKHDVPQLCLTEWLCSGPAGPLPELEDRPLREPDRLDRLRAGTHRQGVHPRDVRPVPQGHHRAPQHLHARTGLRHLLRRRNRHTGSGRHRGGPDLLRS